MFYPDNLRLFFIFPILIELINRIFITTKYIGKASSVKLNTFSAKNAVEALNNHPINAAIDSV